MFYLNLQQNKETKYYKSKYVIQAIQQIVSIIKQGI